MPQILPLSDNRGLYGGASSGNKRTINQNAPFQISTNQNEPQNLPFLGLQKHQHTTAAYENINKSYEDVLARLVKARSKWDETLRNAQSPDDEESRQPSNPYKTLMKQLHDWLHKLPVIGFNSGKYDLNAVKQFLVPYFLSKKEEEEEEMEQDDKEKEEEEENDGVGSFFVIKRNNTFICLSTDKL